MATINKDELAMQLFLIMFDKELTVKPTFLDRIKTLIFGKRHIHTYRVILEDKLDYAYKLADAVEKRMIGIKNTK